ncbi:hypothetical protein GCM10007877_35850 [Marinibactrum halimedae]|uniref:Signal transduction histidine kinase subgroup 3 dimerisation and phosphoacceptor domain-containing protein n=2 Tax=Marinibactrum halimedae TaxID=1444977 RepID=A0AA37TCH3_9GAMM|nr:hypothetical protein GCM10007877_35850 [Marinibactrum halimedae]
MAKPFTPLLINTFSFIAFQFFAMTSTQTRLHAQSQKAALEKAHIELLMMQNMLSEKTKSSERLRISRDLHDSIGQKLTAISLNLEYAKHKPPESLLNFINGLKEDVNDALKDVRRVVSEFRTKESIDITTYIQKLAEKIEVLKFEAKDNIVLNNPALTEQVIFCLQEGISNALRHGKADTIMLSACEKDKNYFHINLADNGQFKLNTSTDEIGGNGLIGMKERLKPYDGKVALLANTTGGAILQLTLNTRYQKACI